MTHAETQREAVRLAPALLTRGGQVQVLDTDGHVSQTLHVDQPAGMPRLWWYQPNWVLYLTLGVLMLVAGFLRAVGDSTGVLYWSAYPQMALGVAIAGVALLSRRRLRRDQDEAIQRIERQLLGTPPS